LASLTGLDPKNSGPWEISVVERVSREDDEIVKDKRVAVRVDITAWGRTGEKQFESSRLLIVSKSELDNCLELRKQLRLSLMSDLRRFVRTIEEKLAV